jgi:DNA-binding NarL/FixJ family response regulator
MNQSRPIVLIEDDSDDTQIFRMAISVLNVEAPVHCFSSPKEAIEFLNTTEVPPGLILCDNHLSAISGIDLRETLAKDSRLHRMTIPFILLSTAISDADVVKAFELPVQGIFLKESSFEKYLDQLDRILKYWSCSITPNSPRPPQGWR